MSSGWQFIEAGWWTHDKLGGVVQDGRGWGCYPLDLKDDAPAYRARTRDAAMRWIEKRAEKGEVE